MDRAHSRETDNPDTGPLSKLPDFDIDNCRVTLGRLFNLFLSNFTDTHYYIDEHILLSYCELTVIHREITKYLYNCHI